MAFKIFQKLHEIYKNFKHENFIVRIYMYAFHRQKLNLKYKPKSKHDSRNIKNSMKLPNHFSFSGTPVRDFCPKTLIVEFKNSLNYTNVEKSLINLSQRVQIDLIIPHFVVDLWKTCFLKTSKICLQNCQKYILSKLLTS